MAENKTTKKTAPARKQASKDPATKDSAARKPAAKKSPKKIEGKLSALDAAAKVLGEASEPLTTKQMIEQMAAQGYWKSPGGQTPQATLFSALHREIQQKGKEARFQKVERGKFSIRK